jgi:hypothetical protein
MRTFELEHAATSPARFRSLLHRQLSFILPPIEPYVKRILTPPSRGRLPKGALESGIPVTAFTGAFTDLILVPGGRFLITRNDLFLVQIWDLGFSASMAIHPYPIASHLEPKCGPEFYAQATADGKGILLLTVSTDEG